MVPKKQKTPKAEKAADLEKERVLFLVATSHLDTQWRWTYEDTIKRFLRATLEENFALFRKFPNYQLSFEGSVRYQMAKEYYPELYEELKTWISKGRWHVCGASVDAGDVNVVSPESIIRNVLYGNGFFKREFGKVSRDVFLPDCFGFGWALPSIMAHCGVHQFSTQKLTWGGWAGIPYNVGTWTGVDGSTVVAAVNGGSYTAKMENPINDDEDWLKRIEQNGAKSGVYLDFKYFGVGDIGGGPTGETVENLEKSLAAQGPIRVLHGPADSFYQLLSEEQKDRLPNWNDELVMTHHATGGYTSMAAMKRWNRKNELLADAAERASVAAAWLGAADYPREKLTRAWERFLANQMHDILPGTCIPQAYKHSWNDEILSLNEFAAVLEGAVGGVSRALDTRAQGVALVVYNPLGIARTGVAEATVDFGVPALKGVDVIGPDGEAVPGQVIETSGNGARILLQATVPANGFAVFDVKPVSRRAKSALSACKEGLENDVFAVALNEDGDIEQIIDKRSGTELLNEPIRLEMLEDLPLEWPAWTIRYEEVSQPPRQFVTGPAKIRVTERGPVRVAVEIRRETAGSLFVQTVSLALGEPIVEIDTRIRWQTRQTLLKVAFPLKLRNKKAVYDLGLGTIERPNNTRKRHEVPAQQWAAISDKKLKYTAGVLTDCKHGWDKPASNTLRLTLLHTPGTEGMKELKEWLDEQNELDFGHHQMKFAVTGDQGDWRAAELSWRAARLNQPLLAFQPARKAEGVLGKVCSLGSVDQPSVGIKAIKLAEETDEIVVRVHELDGKHAKGVALKMAAPIAGAREVNGMEEALGDLTVSDGVLEFDMEPYKPRAFALRLENSPARVAAPECASVDLPFNMDAMSTNARRVYGDIDGLGHTLPAEMVPDVVECEGIRFQMGPRMRREKNAVVCLGQEIALPEGYFDRIYVLAASVGEDVEADFRIGRHRERVTVQRYDGFIGQWDDRYVRGLWRRELDEFHPAYIKRLPVAWNCSHRHAKASNEDEAYQRVYLFRLGFDLPKGTKTLTLPNDDRVRVFALTLARNTNDGVRPGAPLHDELPIPGLH